jgi:hypothetical protein
MVLFNIAVKVYILRRISSKLQLRSKGFVRGRGRGGILRCGTFLCNPIFPPSGR